jgi:hypothetical protein
MANLYKRANGSLVIATSAPSGTTLVAFNSADPLSTNAPIYRGLDSSAATQFHPAIYRTGVPEFGQDYTNIIGTSTDNISVDGTNRAINVTTGSANRLKIGNLGTTYGMAGNRADGTEVFRLDEFGLLAHIRQQTLKDFGGSYILPIRNQGSVYFTGGASVTFNGTSCTITAITSTTGTITTGGTVTGVLAIGAMIGYMASTGKTRVGYITSFVSGTTWNFSLIPGFENSFGGLSSDSARNVSSNSYTGTGAILGNVLTVTVSTTALFPGQIIFGDGIMPGTIITGGSGTSWTVSNAQDTEGNTTVHSPITGIGINSLNIRALLPSGCSLVKYNVKGIGYAFNAALNNSEAMSIDVSRSIFWDMTTNTWAGTGFAQLGEVDSSGSTSFTSAKMSVAIGATLSLELTCNSRASTGTTAANTYFSAFSYVIAAQYDSLLEVTSY